MESVETLCEAVLKARDKRDSAKSALDKADQALSEAQKSLSSAMVDIGQETADVGDKRFATKTKVTWKQSSAQKDEVLKLLKAEAPEVVKESVHASSLSKFMNQKEAEFSSKAPAWWKTLLKSVKRSESIALSITTKK